MLMSQSAEQRLAQLNLELPKPSAPTGNVVPFVIARPFVFLSGQSTMWNGEARFLGSVGRELDLEQAKEATKLCALNLLAQLRVACSGDLDQVAQVVKVTGFVQVADGFTEIPQAVNGASDLFVAVFGERGSHSRTTAGVSRLPRGAAAVVEAVVSLK
jgi:enamine deaminase RidA (YjgF/YER057c/UK114 family)